MTRAGGIFLGATFAGLLACGAPQEQPAARDSTSAPPAVSKAVGGVENVEVTSVGRGASRADAIRDAALRAVEQVHGRAISLTTVSQEIASVQASGTSDVDGVRSSTQQSARITLGGPRLEEATAGMVTSLIVQRESEQNGSWEVHVTAKVAKYTPPSMNKPTVIVGAPRGGGVTALLADLLRERIAGAITNDGELALLDRTEDADAAAEMRLSASGEAPATEALKRGQAKVADFLVQLTVNAIIVDRQARRMRTSDREIVQYAGHADVGYRLMHIATRQVLASGKATADRQSEESLRDLIDAERWKRDMMDEVAGKLSAEISGVLRRTPDGTRDN